MDDVQIQKIEFPDDKGMLSIQARSPAFAALASEYVRIFKEDKGVNYCEWTMMAEGFGLFTVTFQKKGGITPAERAAQYKKALEEIVAKNLDCPSCCSAEIAQKALHDSSES